VNKRTFHSASIEEKGLQKADRFAASKKIK